MKRKLIVELESKDKYIEVYLFKALLFYKVKAYIYALGYHIAKASSHILHS